ncbi:MAG: hypothetical protein K9W45_10915 [Candidatus Heimdallarchaeum aukensis]|uniref:Hydantoinase A/oxoprolinase domain-containing protein n=1 Tax=Candidatus Heimdallarchaeum aukensis TaxID=2876573 RepID=A0A9Y1BL99_9ARCH|nr:MAG: hypothetical protein K9W45_10915 [Candidatus Heimdallarchaeum aukensis]
MNITNSTFFTSHNAIAVLDIGITTQKICVIDPSQPDSPLSYQRILFSLNKKKDEFETFIKSLLRSYSDFGIRDFILTTSAEPVFDSDQEAVSFIGKIVNKYVNNVSYYSLDNSFLSPDEAEKNPSKVVSAGWKALAEAAYDFVKEDFLAIEFSTRTFSLAPVKEGKYAANSRNNYERMLNDELLFIGTLETNLVNIENPFIFDGKKIYLPSFPHARTEDLFFISNDLHTSQTDTNLTLDQIRENAYRNVSKMFCISNYKENMDILQKITDNLIQKILNIIKNAIQQKLKAYGLDKIVLFGIGADLLFDYLSQDEEFANIKIVKGSDFVSVEFSPAFAIGYLYTKKL